MSIANLPEVFNGDTAFAEDVQNIADILLGVRRFNTTLTNWDHPDVATLTLRNLDPNGPALNILTDQDDIILSIGAGGVKTVIGPYLDFKYQTFTPSQPEPGFFRLFVDDQGVVRARIAGVAPILEIPFGEPPAPMARYGLHL